MNKNWKKKRKTIRWTGIVKIQRPLYTNDSWTNCRVYNEDRTIDTHLELCPDQLALTFPEMEEKTYWMASLKWGGLLELNERAEEQPW